MIRKLRNARRKINNQRNKIKYFRMNTEIILKNEFSKRFTKLILRKLQNMVGIK